MEPKNSIKRKRFLNVAAKRVQRVLDAIEILSNCANRSNYEYEDSDIQKMLKAIKESVKNLESNFNKTPTKSKNTFSF